MPHITILGLGPGRWKHLTLEAADLLTGAEEIWLRTRHHPVLDEAPTPLAIRSFDAFYEEAEAFDPLYDRIAAEVVRLGQREEGVLYAVPGHPWVGESTVKRIITRAREAGVPVRVVEGLSFIEPSLATVEADALDGLQIADATTVAGRYYPPFDGDRPVLIGQLYSRMVASDVKLALLELYPAEHPVTLLTAVGTDESRVLTLPLHRLDQQDAFGYLTSLWVPPLAQPSSLPHFQDIIAHLRSPEGCPWDREQDHHTLRGSVLEEAYEVVEAIDNELSTALVEELGDLLLVLVMHAQIASEAGEWNMGDVIATVSEKIVRRHPHVWATTEVSGTEDVLRNWEQIKAAERAGKDEVAREKDVFDEVPQAMPALLRGVKIAKRAAKKGWQAPDPADALARWGDNPGDTSALGELLLAIVAQAAEQKQDPEERLRDAVSGLVEKMRSGRT